MTAQNKQTVLRKTFPVLGMSCASCAAHVGKTLSSLAGVVEANVNLATAKASIQYIPALIQPDEMRKALQSAGYDLMIDESLSSEKTLEAVHRQRFSRLKAKTAWAVVLSVPVVAIAMFFASIPYAKFIVWALSTPVVLWIGRDFFINAWKQLKHRSANMDTLVALSTGVAYLFSVFNLLFPRFWTDRGLQPQVYFETAAVIITFILLGKVLEEKAKGSTSSAIKKLMGLQPKMLVLVREDGSQVQVPVEQVGVGEIVLVKPGEKIALDGKVVRGSSYVDESLLSGEALAVLKNEGDKVFAGTINQKGSFQFRADKVGGDTLLAQIIKTVQDAQGSKAPVQQLVDRIAAIFVPVVIAVAVVAFIAWNVWGGDNAFTQGLLALVTVLVIACPCALGLATPTAIIVGMGKGAEKGILIKDAESLELAQKINAVVLDKTGTVTEGKPQVTDEYCLGNNPEWRKIILGIERQSEHPLAEAVSDYLHDEESAPVSQFESIQGKGAKAVFNNETYFVGNARLLDENKLEIEPSVLEKALLWESEAKTVVLFGDSKRAIAALAVADRIKPSSAEAVAALRKSGIEVHLLTGDNEATARAVAQKTGIRHLKAGVLPEEKANYIKGLQSQGKVVAMVGDGINDSTALAQADVSIAMGKGSDIAMDVAKMTLISSDLTKIPEAIGLSKSTVATIKQNLFWAFIYNIIGIPIAAGVLYPINGFLLNPMIAGAAMALSSLSVVSNSLRLRIKN
ncbi:MAG: heavy metal translocating P-type ATPase [Dysgonamonadaceae bacterium]|jgi:Cu2+-exporting ATPase|nr:heavy metal translocating P-type ATPase [Dysgonamonadaceae bacterium]